jgi:FixJ family two-component response regulator
VTEPRVSVVVVDDDLAVRRGLTRLLRASGYEVETFASARAFLERGDYGRLTCLVLDVRMPGQSGFDVQRVLLGAGYDVPIIFITGHGDAAMAAQAMSAGAVGFITKPFDDDVLLDAVRRAVARGLRLSLPDANGAGPAAS